MSFILYSILLIIVIFGFSYYKSLTTQKETFISELYRPYVRQARVLSEGFLNDNSHTINKIFRKIGLY